MPEDHPFRIPESTLYTDHADEFDEFSPNDLPQYSDFRGSFYKVPWALDEEAIKARVPTSRSSAPRTTKAPRQDLARGSGRWRSGAPT